jgi:glutamate racemase
LPKLEQTCPDPVIGVIRPGAEAAIAATRNRHIGVIGTRATVKSGAYERALRALDSSVKVTSQACPLLVPLIEEGWLEDPLTDRIVARYLEPLIEQEIDTLVLGCTHYPLLFSAIQRALGSDVTLVDSARNCALAVQHLLDQKSLRAPAASQGGLEVALTDKPDNFLRVAREALDLDIGEVEIREVIHQAAS